MVASLYRLRRAGLAGAVGLSAWLAVPVLAADGLSVIDSGAAWPRWQARLGFIDTPGRLGRWVDGTAAAAGRTALLGDYDLGDFGLSGARAQGRFRASGGLLINLRHATGPWATPSSWTWGMGNGELPTSPYLGLGYSGWLNKTGLGFTADVGLVAEPPASSPRLGRALFGHQGQDASLRELRLQPRLQLGVRYSY